MSTQALKLFISKIILLRLEEPATIKNPLKIIAIFFMLLLRNYSVYANNISVSGTGISDRNVNAGLNHMDNYSMIKFNLTWENSWRSTAPNNWDAAWVYAKFRLGATDPTYTGVSSSGTTITVTSTSNLRVGMPVRVTSGTGVFAANTVISAITNATQFEVNLTPTTTLSAAGIECTRIWEHAWLNNSGHQKGSIGSSGQIQAGLVREDTAFHPTLNPAMGIFMYRSATGNGSFTTNNAALRWNYGRQGIKDNDIVDLKVMAIEMVHVPTGSFSIDTAQYYNEVVLLMDGDGLNASQNNTFVDGSSSNNTIIKNGRVGQGLFSPFCGTGGSGYFPVASAKPLETVNSVWNGFAGVSTSFTVEAWVWLDIAANHQIIGNHTSGDATSGWFGISSSNALEFRSWNNTSFTAVTSGTNVVQTKMWHHVAASKNGTTLRLFVDGVQVASGTITSATIPNRGTFIGGRSGDASYGFRGYMSNLRVVQNTSLYNGSFIPPTGPLSNISGTSLLLNFDRGNIDDSRRKSNFETYDNAQINTSQKKYGSGSVSFDGTGDYLIGVPSSDYDFGTGDMTIEAWIYWDGTYSSTGRIIYATGGSGSLDQFGIFSNLGLTWGGIGSNTPANFPPVNQWCHVAASRSGNTIRLFINGTQTATGTQASTIGSATAFPYIGMRSDGFHPFLGYIDDLRIIKGVALYTGNFAPPAALSSSVSGGFNMSTENSISLGGTAGNNLRYSYPLGSVSNDFNAGSAVTLPATYPKGFSGFYAMKYELSQQQWLSFFNSLTTAQKASRDLTGSTGKNGDSIALRNNIRWTSGDATLNGNTYGNTACNYLNWADGLSYADWTGLRPMSELEFEKSARGTISVISGEPASGAACNALPNLMPLRSTANAGASNETPNNLNANACFGNQSGMQGPGRNGIFANDSSTRMRAGASYWGFMELSGNLSEQVVTLGNTDGRSFVPRNGNGQLTWTGFADESGWPGFTAGANSSAAGSGRRGGGWQDALNRLLISDRFFANAPVSARDGNTGFRAARSIPTSTAE